MGHVRTFIEKFRNPNFVGFKAAGSVGSRTASPAPGSVGGAVAPSAPVSTSNVVVNGAVNELQGQSVTGQAAADASYGDVKSEINGGMETSTDATTNGDETKTHE